MFLISFGANQSGYSLQKPQYSSITLPLSKIFRRPIIVLNAENSGSRTQEPEIDQTDNLKPTTARRKIAICDGALLPTSLSIGSGKSLTSNPSRPSQPRCSAPYNRGRYPRMGHLAANGCSTMPTTASSTRLLKMSGISERHRTHLPYPRGASGNQTCARPGDVGTTRFLDERKTYWLLIIAR